MELKSNLELHEKCAGCGKIGVVGLCIMYVEPTKHWTRLGGCAGRTHGMNLKDGDRPAGTFVDPLKASKKAAKGLAKAAKKSTPKKAERRDAR